jgi:NADP-dependent alcohol dehydrogenase
MLNFTFFNPVKIVFGKGQIAALPSLLTGRKNILLTYGGGSIKSNGVFSQVLEVLKDFEVAEFGGIEANPRYETLMKAVQICREQKIDFLLAVGGGSVIDGTKFIAAAAKFQGEEPWDILAKSAPVVEALPFGAVLTLSATGSEMNSFSVVSRTTPPAKLSFASGKVYPQFSILDPETTMSLPERQIINGIIDPFVHVTEQYLTKNVSTPLQDRQACAVLSTLVEIGPKVLSAPKDYDLRSNLMWCATQALNGVIGAGAVQDWATHQIGHELTSAFDLDHAQTLAVILPALLKHQISNKKEKLAQYGKWVWGLQGSDEVAIATQAITKTEVFFRSLGAKTKLSEYGIKASDHAGIATRVMAVMKVPFGENRNIGLQEINEILAIAQA